MVLPPLAHLSAATAYQLGALGARHDLADTSHREAFQLAWLALTWKRFIAEFGASEHDVHQTSLALTTAATARHIYLRALAESDRLALRLTAERAQNINRTLPDREGLAAALAQIDAARRIWTTLTAADLAIRITAYVAQLRTLPDFLEGTREYAVIHSGARSVAFERQGQRAAAWAANLAIVGDFAGFASITPLPCYGLVTREMLRADVRLSAVPALVDRALGAIAAEWSERLAALQSDLPRDVETPEFRSDAAAARIRVLLHTLGPIASYQLPPLLGCARSTALRALRRLIAAGLVRYDRATRIITAARRPAPAPDDQAPLAISGDLIAELDDALAAADRINARWRG